MGADHGRMHSRYARDPSSPPPPPYLASSSRVQSGWGSERWSEQRPRAQQRGRHGGLRGHAPHHPHHSQHPRRLHPPPHPPPLRPAHTRTAFAAAWGGGGGAPPACRLSARRHPHSPRSRVPSQRSPACPASPRQSRRAQGSTCGRRHYSALPPLARCRRPPLPRPPPPPPPRAPRASTWCLACTASQPCVGSRGRGWSWQTPPRARQARLCVVRRKVQPRHRVHPGAPVQSGRRRRLPPPHPPRREHARALQQLQHHYPPPPRQRKRAVRSLSLAGRRRGGS